MTIADILVDVQELRNQIIQDIADIDAEITLQAIDLEQQIDALVSQLGTLGEVEELLMGDLVAILPVSPPGGSASATGTMFSAPLSQDLIVPGDRTFIITLTADTWVASGATFNAQRQNIIDGIDSDKAEANGWDAERSNLNVTDVVRASDTVVTITLSALSNYVITSPETLTITVPASALVTAGPYVVPQAATITQLFILIASGTVTTTSNGQVIEKLLITADSASNGVNINHNNVIVRHCQIKHNQSTKVGVQLASGVTGTLMEDVDVIHTGAPSSGALPSAAEVNIHCQAAVSSTFNRIRTQDGSSGFYVLNGSDITVDKHESIDQRGPFPRGQAFQSNTVAGGSYTNGNAVNDRTVAWTEDNINLFNCTGSWAISDCLIDGNNAPSGVGTMVEGGTATVTFTDMDVIRMGNGAFGHGGTGSSLTYTRCNARENSNLNWQSRGFPSSSTPGEIEVPDRAPITFSSLTSGNGTNFVDCEYFDERGSDGADAPYSANLAFDQNFMGTKDWSLVDFTMQTGYVFVPTWIV